MALCRGIPLRGSSSHIESLLPIPPLYPNAMYEDVKRDFVESKDGDWMVGADGVIVCPCGNRIEDDGQCPNGHESPMLSAGLI